MGSLLRFPGKRPPAPELARWKVPFRNVYCENFAGWWRETLWCHLVLRVFPHAHDFGTDALTELYIGDPLELHDQLLFLLRDVRETRKRRARERELEKRTA